jgi:MFS family permease
VTSLDNHHGAGTPRHRGGEGARGRTDRPEAEPTEVLDVPPGGRPADYRQPLSMTALNGAKALGRGLGRVTRGGARVTAHGGRYATSKYRTYTHSGGAGETGLARVVDLHGTHSAGDAIMMLALAGTIFFNPQTVQARDQVALFLLLTMVPFALVAPLLGPLLDRFSHGRRWALGTTMASRAFLLWVLAEAVIGHSNWLFPAALGYLVASKAYTVVRAAAVPRVLPEGLTLVQANSKVSIAGVVGGTVGGAIAAGLMWFGPPWALRAGFVVFVIGTIQSIRLPARIDSSAGELDPEDTAPIPIQPAQRHTPASASGDGTITVDSLGFYGRAKRRVRAIPWPVRHALWSTGGTRLLTGFLILFMAFLAKSHPISGVRGELVLGFVVVAIGIGNALGSVLGNVLKAYRPERVAMVAVLVAILACVATAIWYGVLTLVIMGLVQGLTSQLAKLCLDALVQQEISEQVRTSVFAWSETTLQMLWVVGGGLGIVGPLNPHVGFPVAAAALFVCVLFAARTRHVGRPARVAG